MTSRADSSWCPSAQVSRSPTGAPQILSLDGNPVSISNGTLNLTLSAGMYSLSLQNFSNASETITIAAGGTTFVNLTGAGKVVFVASGLPSGATWGLSVGGEMRSAPNRSLAFNLPNGTYVVNYSVVPGFFRNASAPRQVTVPVAAHIVVAWSLFTYNVSFTESGLPPSTSWWVSTANSLEVGNGSTLEVSAPNGTTTFTVGSGYAFVAAPSQGSVNITKGEFAPVDVLFSYRPTFISGTVSPSNATLTIDAVPQTLQGGAFNASVIPGSYTLVASATGYASKTITANTTAGNVTEERILLVALTTTPSGLSPPSSGPSNLPVGLVFGGIVVAGVAVALVSLLLLRRRSGPR